MLRGLHLLYRLSLELIFQLFRVHQSCASENVIFWFGFNLVGAFNFLAN